MKRLLICGFIQFALVILTFNVFAITIDGHIFENIHVFKHISDNSYELGEVNRNDRISNFFLSADPVAAGTWSWELAIKHKGG